MGRAATDFSLQHGRGGLYWTRAGVGPPEVEPGEVLAEVVRAEPGAERPLLRRWDAVGRVAEALSASPTHRLTGKEVTGLCSKNLRSSG